MQSRFVRPIGGSLLQAGVLAALLVIGFEAPAAAPVAKALVAPGPRVSLRRAPSLDVIYVGAPELAAVLGGTAEPLALATGDLDLDGLVDLVAGYGVGSSGALAVLHGDATTGFTRQAEMLALPEPPDFVAFGDFDGDGAPDVVAAARGGLALHLFLGDGKGGLRWAPDVALSGRLTAFVAGEINRGDGLRDLVLGVQRGSSAEVQIFSAPHGALTAEPRVISVAAPVSALALGQFDGDYPYDLAIAAGRSVIVVLGAEDGAGAAEPPLVLPGRVVALASGRFTPGPQHQIAALLEDGAVHVLAGGVAGRLRDTTTFPAGDGATRLASGKLSAGDGDDLIVVAPSARQIRAFSGGEEFGSGAANVTTQNEPAAVAAFAANDDTRTVLAVVSTGENAPALLRAATFAGPFTVNSTADNADAVPGDGICADAGGACTLRAAIQEANASGGFTSINFNIGAGNPTIGLVGGALPTISKTVSIDGGAGPGGATRVVINCAATAGPGLYLAAGSSGSQLRSLVIYNAGGSNPGIKIESATNSVENCYIGTDANGGATATGNSGGGILITGPGATSNSIGGSPARRNLISHNSVFGVRIDANAQNNTVGANFIGTDALGAGPNSNPDGVSLQGGARNNTIGGAASSPGTAPGNVISGNTVNGVNLSGSTTTGNLVQGNLIGVQVNGTSSRPNSSNGVVIQSSANNNTIGGSTVSFRNVISANLSDGVELNGSGANNNVIAGNYIGVDITGAGALGNNSNGVYLWGGPQGNVIGGDSGGSPGAPAGNVISGNSGSGVYLQNSTSSGNAIQGNLIGTDATGTLTKSNFVNGVTVDGSTGTVIGGATTGLRNVISGHFAGSANGIEIRTGGSNNTTIAGNYIGTDITGRVAIANYTGIKVWVSGGGTTPLTGTVIGGATSAPGTPPGNVVSGNSNDGILLYTAYVGGGTTATQVAGNLIGLKSNGTEALKNFGNGVQVFSAHDIVVGGTTTDYRNVISGNAGGGGVNINGSTAQNNSVVGNYIGTDITGNVAIPNASDGVVVKLSASANKVGDSGAAPPGAPPGNLISGNGGHGVQIYQSTNNKVAGNVIGLRADNTGALPNAKDGVYVYQPTSGAANNTIGGTGGGLRNVISGNTKAGVEISQSIGNYVLGNYIGLDRDGLVAFGNGAEGVLVWDANGFTSADNNFVGGPLSGNGNVIGGNFGAGVKLSGAFCNGGLVAGNTIGLDPSGSTPLSNGGGGVYLTSGSSNNTVGGTTGLTLGTCTGPCNTIWDNTGAGIRLDGSGTRNAFRGNSIVTNSALGIDIGPAGVTPNDPGDGDAGANNLQNFPAVTSVTWNGASTVVSGTLDSTPSASFAIEVFASQLPDPSNYGEGQTYLGAVNYTVPPAGPPSWTVVAPGYWQYITATATDGLGNSSEFSRYQEMDGDGDGYVDSNDCAPASATVWKAPLEVAALVFAPPPTNVVAFSWGSLATQAGPGTVYDVMRGALGEFPVGSGASEVCLQNNLAATAWSDGTPPAPGTGFFYLVRGENVCGVGKYGAATSGEPEITPVCAP